MEISERIKYIIESYGFSPSEFADTIDVPRSSISHITSGRNKPSLDFIMKIKNQFPEIKWEWLIDGKGEMKEISEISHEVSNTLSGHFEFLANEADPAPKEPILDNRSESPIPHSTQERNAISDSQRLGFQEIFNTSSPDKKIKRIVFFYEDGTFEVFN
ncbi:helix-turn-helix domain-containing protein [Elizabethkingia sp. JS20170427COW]|uniref:helix-turn-helix domain-containing protein n=1 Tax=Elizabethkingia sp. JS20170427COW TaxID=2583851 RepID=UPI001110DE97|nr:helix-turn-helix transcriptional regulator [Elizabethkingia sp. JS20170427COW]QCX54244.1 helix-turn-helix transcriptional regulator [Elizabethkingia sp. JS20170427COW]